jgi:hypothetical protein
LLVCWQCLLHTWLQRTGWSSLAWCAWGQRRWQHHNRRCGSLIPCRGLLLLSSVWTCILYHSHDRFLGRSPVRNHRIRRFVHGQQISLASCCRINGPILLTMGPIGLVRAHVPTRFVNWVQHF